MLSKRLVVCLDVSKGRLVKGVKFSNTKDIGDPVERAKQYYQDGLDELVFYDISASSDKQPILLELVERVAGEIFIPLSVGGAVSSVSDATDLRLAGAEKINLNTQAVLNPNLITQCAEAIGSQSTILSIDVRRTERSKMMPSGFEIVIQGGRRPMNLDALSWVKRGVELGAGEIVVNSIDADGVGEGYDLELTRAIVETVPVPVIASGGAGRPEHLTAALQEAGADAALVASMVHFGAYKCSELKQYLHDQGVKVRPL